MHYTNSQMKLDQLIGYFNGKKINLIPPFQRGHVWGPETRKKLLANMVAGRPIPAIFLYKEPVGSQFEYNILDGKQRLESLLLFIGSSRADLGVKNVKDYFFTEREKKQLDFSVSVDGNSLKFNDFPDELVRDFREYAIPTIEIDLDDDTSLDEIIELFVDINQQGDKVKRFDIVKAIGKKNKLLRSVLDLIAREETRKHDKRYKTSHSAYTRVLGRLQTVEKAASDIQKVDRMWERLFEVALFNRTRKHQQPGQILKSFIKKIGGADASIIKPQEKKTLRRCFDFLDKCYKNSKLGETRLARDLPHFYTMVTSLMVSDLLDADGAPPDFPSVRRKLLKFAELIADDAPRPKDRRLAKALEEYKQAAARQTTHPGRRATRQAKFLEIMAKL